VKHLVFKAGNYPQGSVSIADVKEIASNYDRNYHEAPLTLNHYDDPIFGIVDEVEANDNGELYVTFSELDENIVNLVNAGKYRKPSIEIADYTDKGKYLRAVSLTNFPQVKNLPRITFSDNGVEKEVKIISDNKISFSFNNQNYKNMDLKKFIEKFKSIATGKFAEEVPATAEELIEILFQMIEVWKTAQSEAEAELTELKNKVKQYEDDKINALIAQAKQSGKLTDVAAFEELAKSNYEQAVKLLEAIPEPKIFEQNKVKTGNANTANAKLTYADILKDPKIAKNFSEQEIETLRKEFLNIN
jgi:uncharacterized tellurite resistance protein B-like protein